MKKRLELHAACRRIMGEEEGENMGRISRSEVCALLGISRRALQGYNEIGLVKPIVREDSGYWEYDEAAVRRLMLVHVFTKAGYTRREVKQVLTLSDEELLCEYDRAAERLRQQRRIIEGTLNVLRAIRLASEVPLMALLAESPVPAYSYGGENFAELFDAAVEAAAGAGETEEARAALPFWDALGQIGRLRDEMPGAESVRQSVGRYYAVFWKTVLDTDDVLRKNGLTAEELTPGKRAVLFRQLTERVLADEKAVHLLDLQSGEGTAAFIRAAVGSFCESLPPVGEEDDSL